MGGSSQVGFGSAAYKAPLGARTFKKSNFYTAFIPETEIMREQNGIRHGETEGDLGAGPEHHLGYT